MGSRAFAANPLRANHYVKAEKCPYFRFVKRRLHRIVVDHSFVISFGKCRNAHGTLSYTITGGAARHEKVKPKTWIFTLADDNWYHHHGYWYYQLPLTRLISELATIFGYIVMLRARMFHFFIIRTGIKERNIRARNITT